MCWGPDNREATVRVPSTFWGMEQASTNLEFKPTDASCNPYLAFGGLIAAGLDGMERELTPEPLSVDPATLSDRAGGGGAHRYPTRLQDSIEALERDQVLVEALGDLAGPLLSGRSVVRVGSLRGDDGRGAVRRPLPKY